VKRSLYRRLSDLPEPIRALRSERVEISAADGGTAAVVRNWARSRDEVREVPSASCGYRAGVASTDVQTMAAVAGDCRCDVLRRTRGELSAPLLLTV